MLGTILIVILILALLGVLPKVVAQQKLGLCPDRRSRVNSPSCSRSSVSRTHLSHVAHIHVERRQHR